MFTLVRPNATCSPVIVEIPHAGTLVPHDLRGEIALHDDDVLRDADLYVDQLWERTADRGGTLLVSHVSRYVADLNRRMDEVDARAVEPADDGPDPAASHPRGVVWRESSSGRQVLRRRLTRAQFSARLARFYQPYHAALTSEIENAVQRFGYAVVLSAHSMPSTGRTSPTDPAIRRADVVPGTNGGTTASPRLIDFVDRHFRSAGLSVRHDDPYRGGATTRRWGRPGASIHAIQLELNRALYMSEASLRIRQETFDWLAGLCADLVAGVVNERP